MTVFIAWSCILITIGKPRNAEQLPSWLNFQSAPNNIFHVSGQNARRTKAVGKKAR